MTDNKKEIKDYLEWAMDVLKVDNHIHVAVVGGGIIGKRVADAVQVQSDMKLVGIADVDTSAFMSIEGERGYDLFAGIIFDKEGNRVDTKQKMEAVGLKISGNIEDLIAQSDVVVDATPVGLPEKNIPLYLKSNPHIKIIVEGGEKHNLWQKVGLAKKPEENRSFSTFANYYENEKFKNFGEKYTRVVSCNTTALCRILSTLNDVYTINQYFAVLVRRGTDPPTAGKEGPSNAVVPVLGGSHHYEDVETCLPQLIGKGYSVAVAIGHTLSHVHTLELELEKDYSKEKIVELFRNIPRMRVVKGKADGVTDTAKVAELYRDMGRLRADHPEVTIWEEGIQIKGKKLYILFDVHMESIPIPENIDAIRSLKGTVSDGWESARLTDIAMNRYLPGFAKAGNLYIPVKQRIESYSIPALLEQIQSPEGGNQAVKK